MGQIIIPPSHREDARGSLENIVIECETNAVSDSYHTFGELYDHRCLLFLAFLSLQNSWFSSKFQVSRPGWRSRTHHDGSVWEGWFIAGTKLNGKQISYHLPNSLWDSCHWLRDLETAPEWDGHTSQDVLTRLQEWINL